jgi:uncharacterized protein
MVRRRILSRSNGKKSKNDAYMVLKIHSKTSDRREVNMITDEDKAVIMQCAKKYNVSSVVVFGSSLNDNVEAHDIDLGVKGLDPRQFFKFYAELFKHLSKPVDLVDITRKTLFNDLVEESGVQIYG